MNLGATGSLRQEGIFENVMDALADSVQLAADKAATAAEADAAQKEELTPNLEKKIKHTKIEKPKTKKAEKIAKTLLLPVKEIEKETGDFKGKYPDPKYSALNGAKLKALPEKMLKIFENKESPKPAKIKAIIAEVRQTLAGCPTDDPDLEDDLFTFLLNTTSDDLKELVREAKSQYAHEKASALKGKPVQESTALRDTEKLNETVQVASVDVETGEPLETVELMSALLKACGTDKKIIDTVTVGLHQDGDKLRNFKLEDALMLNIGKEVRSKQDVKQMVLLAHKIKERTTRECELKGLIPPVLNELTLVTTFVRMLQDGRISSDKIHQGIHDLHLGS